MDQTDTIREKHGYHTVEAVVRDIGRNNTVLDPHSLLISSGTVVIGTGNTFYPNVVIETKGGGTVHVGDNNVFYPGVYVLSSAGSVKIGDQNEFGTGGCTIKANMPTAAIRIGNGGRYCDGASIMGVTELGSGSQVLGPITVQSCSLASGGTFEEPDPDKRAAVLKGFGLARNMSLLTGQVVNGAGNFSQAVVEWQHDYHPKS